MTRRTAVVFGTAIIGASYLALAACGKTSDDVTPPDASQGDRVEGGGSEPFEASDPSYDASYDASHPEGGPAPVVACDGGTCTLPASVCLDDLWLRYYTGGTCDADAGVCMFEAKDQRCDVFGPPPYCYQGGCRAVIVR